MELKLAATADARGAWLPLVTHSPANFGPLQSLCKRSVRRNTGPRNKAPAVDLELVAKAKALKSWAHKKNRLAFPKESFFVRLHMDPQGGRVGEPRRLGREGGRQAVKLWSSSTSQTPRRTWRRRAHSECSTPSSCWRKRRPAHLQGHEGGLLLVPALSATGKRLRKPRP